MSTYDDYLTHDDKPYAENINDALLLSNVFDLTVPIELPTMFRTGVFNSSEYPRKAGVAIFTLVSYTGLTIGDTSITNSESEAKSLVFKYYPNFNSYGSITNLSWTASGTGVTANIVGADGTPIKTGHTGGAITGADPKLSDLQEFTITLSIPAGVSITKLNFNMANKDAERYGAECGITDVTGLTEALASKSNTGHTHVTEDITDLTYDDTLTTTSTNAPQTQAVKTELNNIRKHNTTTTLTITNKLESASATLTVRNGWAHIYLLGSVKNGQTLNYNDSIVGTVGPTMRPSGPLYISAYTTAGVKLTKMEDGTILYYDSSSVTGPRMITISVVYPITDY